MELQTGIERLRASKKKNESQEYDRGLEEGKHWATDEADYETLRDVAKLEDDPCEEYGEDCTANRLDAAAECLELDPDETSSAYARGFINGAAEVFKLV